MYPKLTQFTELDGEHAFSARGWKLNMYKTSGKPLRYSKSILELSDDISVEEVNLLEGSWRIRGTLDSGRLYIGIYTGLNIHRTIGELRPTRIATISMDGSEWDMLADAPVSGVSVSFGPRIVDRILSPEQKEILSTTLSIPNLNKCIAFNVTKNVELFERLLKWTLLLGKDKNFLKNSDSVLNQFIEDLLASSSDLVGGLSELNRSSARVPQENKVILAERIEALFWGEMDRINFDPYSLDELSRHFNVSRRTIQLAIEKTFNTNFTDFSRMVRLHKANREIQTKQGVTVTDVALKHGFDHLGRFSSYYKSFFGSLPSEHRKS